MPLDKTNILNSLIDKGRAYEICENLKTDEYKTAQLLANESELAYTNIHRYLKFLVKANVVQVKDLEGENLKYKLRPDYKAIKSQIEARQSYIEDAESIKGEIKQDLEAKEISKVTG